MRIGLKAIILVLPFISSCFPLNKVGDENELVISQGMVIKATNANGTVAIEAGKGLERTYGWNGHTVQKSMRPRRERWYGSLGAYHPGGGSDIHALAQEGQQHFCSEQEALEWLDWKNDRFKYVYTSDGLVVGWYTVQSEKRVSAVSVEVWQFYIMGKKPVRLAGARNDAIVVTYKEGVSSQQQRPVKFQPSKPKKVNGRWYSGKSVDIMSERGIKTDSVEKCISEGKGYRTGKYLNCNYNSPDGFLWVKMDESGRVVLLGQ